MSAQKRLQRDAEPAHLQLLSSNLDTMNLKESMDITFIDLGNGDAMKEIWPNRYKLHWKAVQLIV